jgi:hypothetical protein
MHLTNFEILMHPPESYSRQLDEAVLAQEMPYGYTMSPPAADSGNYDQRAMESDKQYSRQERNRL